MPLTTGSFSNVHRSNQQVTLPSSGGQPSRVLAFRAPHTDADAVLWCATAYRYVLGTSSAVDVDTAEADQIVYVGADRDWPVDYNAEGATHVSFRADTDSTVHVREAIR